MLGHSLNFVDWKQRKEVAAYFRLIYAAATESEADFQGRKSAMERNVIRLCSGMTGHDVVSVGLRLDAVSSNPMYRTNCWLSSRTDFTELATKLLSG
jgi:hypothetical protein